MERWVGETSLGELGGGKNLGMAGGWVKKKKNVKGRCLKQALESWEVKKTLER